MGYLIVAHVTKQAPDTAKLAAALPSSIAWSLHRDDEANAFYIDTYKAGRAQEWPFTSMPPTKDISLEFAPDLASLQAVYRALEEAQLANAFKRGLLNMNLALSKALQLPVCSLCSDDEGLDFVCISESGRLQRLRCECGDLDIVYEPGKVTIQPLLQEEEDDLTDMSDLHDPLTGIQVLDRNVTQTPLLHFVASTEVTAFLGVKQAPLGLGSFDGMESPPRKVAGSAPAPAPTPPPAPLAEQKKAWWKLW